MIYYLINYFFFSMKYLVNIYYVMAINNNNPITVGDRKYKK